MDIIAGIILVVPGAFFSFAGFVYIVFPPGRVTTLDYAEFRLAFLIAVLGVVAIVGGNHASNRKNWRLAMAGSACAALVLLGIPAIILLARSKKEFLA